MDAVYPPALKKAVSQKQHSAQIDPNSPGAETRLRLLRPRDIPLENKDGTFYIRPVDNR